MRKVVHTSRFWVMLLALVCAGTTAFNLTFFAHLAVCHSNHEHHQGHDADEKMPLSHQHKNCPTCHLLLGPGGKFALLSPVETDIQLKPVLFTYAVNSPFIYQRATIPFSVRGPPPAS